MRTVFKVEGMSCSHCEKAVMKALSGLGGVNGVKVDLHAKTVEVEHDERLLHGDIAGKIEELGFDVVD